MVRNLATGLLLVAALSGLGGCAEVDESGGIGIHPSGWSTPGAAQSHAVALADAGLPNSVQACADCHGADYGMPAMECFACHASGAAHGHPASGFVGPSGADFHGRSVIEASGYDGCAHCHAFDAGDGIDFELGGWAQQTCTTCHGGGPSGHPARNEWLNPSAANFHGVAAAGGMITDCAQCHGADYLGGWTGVSCNDCHPSLVDIHPEGWVGSSATEGTHGWLIAGGELAVSDCQACHGADFQGGWTGQDCQPCHDFSRTVPGS